MADQPKDTVALITGGNRGIGFETARQLAEKGILPIIGARTAEGGADAVTALAAEGLSAKSIVLDVSNSQQVKAAYDYINETYGKLDILINNAGIHIEGEPGVKALYSASTVPEEVLRRTFDVNFFATVAVTNTLLPLIRKSEAGRIVILSTILASLTLMADPNSPIYEMKNLGYDSSKVALNAYTVQLAHDLRGTPIKVNAAHPGWVKSEMGGSKAMMELADGAKTSVALATLLADGPSGSFIHLGEPLPW